MVNQTITELKTNTTQNYLQVFIVAKEVYWVLSEQVQNPVLAKSGTNQGLVKLIFLFSSFSLFLQALSAFDWLLSYFLNTNSFFKSWSMWSNLLIDFLHVKALCSCIEFSKCSLVSSIFTVEIIFLGGDESLSAAASVCRLADCAGPGGCWFIGTPLCISRLVVGAADAVVCT